MQNLKKTDRYYICHGEDIHGGRITGADGNHSYATKKEAAKQAKLFKDDPKGKNPAMSDDSAEYWKNQPLCIVRVVETQEVKCRL